MGQLHLNKSIMANISLLNPQCKIPDVEPTKTTINGKEVDFDLNDWAGSYNVIITMTGAGNKVSEETLKNFTMAVPKFEHLQCKLLAIFSDSTSDIFQKMDDSVKNLELIPIMSDKNTKVLSHLGVLQNGERRDYPANAVFIVDKSAKVRYTSVLEPTVAHSPASVLRLVGKFQATDDGDHLVMSGDHLPETLIANTSAGIKEYYRTRFRGLLSSAPEPKLAPEPEPIVNKDLPESREKQPRTGSSDAESLKPVDSVSSPAPHPTR